MTSPAGKSSFRAAATWRAVPDLNQLTSSVASVQGSYLAEAATML
jgi:hypothetical protein